MIDCIAAIMGVWLSLAPAYMDRHEPIEAREALYWPVARTVCEATSDHGGRAFLAAQAYHETRLARHVLEERYSDGPRGFDCDSGRSIGPWQPRRSCPGAWNMQLTRRERYLAGARCALLLYWLGRHRCGTIEGGIVANGGSGECHRVWARARVPLCGRMFAVLR